jgi:hypothetical protein
MPETRMDRALAGCIFWIKPVISNQENIEFGERTFFHYAGGSTRVSSQYTFVYPTVYFWRVRYVQQTKRFTPDCFHAAL